MIPVDAVPFWLLGMAIFALRIVDVSIGTVRTIFMVQGHQRWAVLLGFFEVLVWLLAVSQVVIRINESPWLAPFFAGGFAAGVWVGMAIERWLALGRYVIRLISRSRSREIVESLRGHGHVLATFVGEAADGPVNLVFVSARGPRVRTRCRSRASRAEAPRRPRRAGRDRAAGRPPRRPPRRGDARTPATGP